MLFIETWKSEIFAGEDASFKIRVHVNDRRELRILAAQFVGHLKIDKKQVDSERLLILKGRPGYHISGSGNLGGGLISKTIARQDGDHIYPIYSTPPSIIASDSPDSIAICNNPVDQAILLISYR